MIKTEEETEPEPKTETLGKTEQNFSHIMIVKYIIIDIDRDKARVREIVDIEKDILYIDQ